MDFESLIKKELKKELDIEINLEVPPNQEMGDFAFPCFILSKKLKKSPVQISKDLSDKIKIKNVEVKAIGSYLNFFVSKEKLSQDVITKVLEEKESYGSGENKKEKIMLEFSGPNPFKGFHIGHLRNTVLGEATSRILSFAGFKVMPVNYLNDTGKHVAKCLWGIENLYQNKIPKGDKGEWLGEVYSEASQKLSENINYEEEVSQIHQKLENKDKEYIKKWQEGKIWSEEHFNNIYKDLDVHFDKVFYDSDYVDKGKEIVDNLIKKEIAKKDEGSILVDLEKYNLHKVLVLRTDGTALYITKDLAMAMDRMKKFKPDRLLYVVGSEQKLHFQQVFKILDLLGFKQAKKAHHLSYELVRLKERKMSSRKGDVILYSGLKKQIMDKLKQEVESRHKEWSKKEKEESINNIFSAAIKFDMIVQDPNKTITFDIDKALDFEGDSGPYIQYSHARICSIIKKIGDVKKADLSLLTSNEEVKLITSMSNFSKVVEDSAEGYRPALIARYLLELSQDFNEFYHSCKILDSEDELKHARIMLIKAVRQVIENGLNLLAIKAPESM